MCNFIDSRKRIILPPYMKVDGERREEKVERTKLKSTKRLEWKFIQW